MPSENPCRRVRAWACLLLFFTGSIRFVSALQGRPRQRPNGTRLRKSWLTLAAGSAIYLLFGAVYVLTDQLRDYMQKLCVAAVACERPASLPFQQIASVAELETALSVAEANQDWLMLAVYADWCVACKEMEVYTFAEPRVQEKLRKIMLLQLDVTENNPQQQAFLRRFGLIGPPAVLFFAPDRQEQKSHRVIGFMDSELFLNQLHELFNQQR